MKLGRLLVIALVPLALACGSDGEATDTATADDVAAEASDDAVADALPDTATPDVKEVVATDAHDTAADPAAEAPVDLPPAETADDVASDPAPTDTALDVDCAGIDPVAYSCPDGGTVPWCACTALGNLCVDHPEYQCATLCHKGQYTLFDCPDATQVAWCTCTTPKCEPKCDKVGTADEGWYDSCTGDVVKVVPCAGCGLSCGAVGSKSEGWVSSCSGLLTWTSCAPTMDCAASPSDNCMTTKCTAGQASTYTCPDGAQRPFCTCQPACAPTCQQAGTANEGWYDCNGTLLQKVACAGCTSKCDLVGSKSEGWYAGCAGGTSTLIGWAMCSVGSWQCVASPWDQCSTPVACVGEGQGFDATGGDGSQVCCPGLVDIEQDGWDGKDCAYPNCLCRVCTLCGDGHCVAPENVCNCPADCTGTEPRQDVGGLCAVDTDCVAGLTCAVNGGLVAGVCTKVCDPTAEIKTACGAGRVCLPLPNSQAPGFCLAACKVDGDCQSPLACGGNPPGATSVPTQGGCFGWGACDPMLNAWCGPAAPQCHVQGGKAACGPAGTLKKNDKCDKANDLCGPGLVCGSLSQCWPACSNDDNCKPTLDFCLKNPVDATWGHCMVLE